MGNNRHGKKKFKEKEVWDKCLGGEQLTENKTRVFVRKEKPMSYTM